MLIGSFFVGGLVLLLAAIIAAGGGHLFSRTERTVMFFSGSIYGLQVGAPVVFRGVQMGSVASIGMVYDPKNDQFSIPVVAELDPQVIRSLGGQEDGHPDLPALVRRGLQARLAMQSLLTGQLYIDLDIRPPTATSQVAAAREVVEIPTAPTAIQALKNQFEGLDFRQLAEDVSAIAGSARALVAGPELKQTMHNVVEITAQVRRITGELDQRIGPVARSAQGTLDQGQVALARLSQAADAVNGTAQRLGVTADRVNTLVAPDSPLVLDVQRSADELAKTAAALRSHVTQEDGVVQHMDQALADVSRAARAVRELADLLDRQPQALLRGRGTPSSATPP